MCIFNSMQLSDPREEEKQRERENEVDECDGLILIGANIEQDDCVNMKEINQLKIENEMLRLKAQLASTAKIDV